MGGYKLKISIYGVENDQKCPNLRHKKSGRFVIFSIDF
jgi:hypothetical protein